MAKQRQHAGERRYVKTWPSRIQPTGSQGQGEANGNSMWGDIGPLCSFTRYHIGHEHDYLGVSQAFGATLR